MSKQLVINAFRAVEMRVLSPLRNDIYSPEGRTARALVCAQCAHELERGTQAGFSRMWGHMLRGQYSDQACDVMDEVFDEVGVNTIDELNLLMQAVSA
jgi:hypothetical protein